MRAIVVGPLHSWSTADVARGWASGLRAQGVATAEFNLAQLYAWYASVELDGDFALDRARVKRAVGLNLLGETYDIDPDLVVVVHGADVSWDAVATLRCPKVLVLTECPYENEAQLYAAAQMQPDLILVNDPTGADVFEQVAPTHYIAHAYDPEVHYPGTGDHKWDCAFVGTGFANRVEFMERVDWSGIDLAIGGLWASLEPMSPLHPFLLHSHDATECIDNAGPDGTASIYRASRTAFNIYRTDTHGEHSTADGWAIGPREVELAATATWYARHSRPESDELFPMLPTFAEPEELGDLIRWALAHPVERQRAATEAQAAVADRTFANHAGRLLRRLGF